jgi:hypothetical protein
LRWSTLILPVSAMFTKKRPSIPCIQTMDAMIIQPCGKL